MAYGTIKVDNITFDNGGVDKLITVSGLFYSTSGALTVTGTISGGNVTAPTATFTTLTGTTTAGTTATFTSGSFTTLTGTTVTGTTANFVSGVFTTQISGASITGTTVTATTGNYTSLTGVTTTGTTANFVTFNGASGVFTTRVSGATVTGTTANFTSGNFISLSGTTTTVTSGVFSAGSATAPSVAVGTGTTYAPGIYSPGADQLAISTGGISRLAVSTTAVSSTLAVDVPLGAAATPGITFTGDLNTGIYSPGADQVAISTNGTRRLDVNSSGQFRIGDGGAFGIFSAQAVANGNLHIRDIASVIGFGTGVAFDVLNDSGSAVQDLAIRAANTIFRNSAGETLRITSTGALNFVGAGAAGSTQAVSFNGSAPVNSLVIDSLGKVGIGTSNPSFPIETKLTGSDSTIWGYNVAQFADATANNTGLRIGTNTSTSGLTQLIAATASAASQFGFWTYNGSAWGERMRIDSAGRLGIGTTDPAGSTTGPSLDVNGPLFVRSPILTHQTNAGVLQYSGNETSIRSYGGAAGSGQIVFNTGGGGGSPDAERARIDSSGRLLVGTSSTFTNVYQATTVGIQAPLQVRTATNDYNSGATYLNYSASGFAPVVTLGLSKNNTAGSNTIVAANDELGYLQFVGNDGTNFRTAAWIAAYSDGTPGAGVMPGRLVFSTTPDGAASPSPRMTITNGGNILMNTMSALGGNQVSVRGGSTVQLALQDSGTTSFYHYMGSWNTGTGNFAIVHSSGTGVQLSGSSATSWSSFSDVRLKNITGSIPDALNKVDKLEPIYFSWKSDSNNTPCVGLSGQSVREVLPEATDLSKQFNKDEDDQEYVSIRYTDVIPLLVAALKESKERIETLEVSNADLLARVTALETA